MRDMDAVLGGEERLVPSSGFLDRVMDAVHREISEPEPLAFPWLRALPGIAAALFALAAVVYFGFRESVGLSMPGGSPVQVSSGAGTQAMNHLSSLIGSAASARNGWMALALVLTAGCIHFSLRLGADK